MKTEMKEVILQIVNMKGVEVLKNKNLFCAMIDDMAYSLLDERRIFRQVLTDEIMGYIYEAYMSKKENRFHIISKLRIELNEVMGIKSEWCNYLISVFSEAFDWEYKSILEKENCKIESNDEEIELSSNKDFLAEKRKYIKPFQKLIATGVNHVVAITLDGKVLATGQKKQDQCDVEDWNDIVEIDAGAFNTIGLKSNGQVMYTGVRGTGNDSIEIKRKVPEWSNIKSVTTGISTIGLKTDGTVVAIGSNRWGECDVEDWNDIVEIGTEGWNTYGLRGDGTVVAAGDNRYGQCNISNWENIVAIAVGTAYVVGLKADGTVVAVGANRNGECNVGEWKDIIAISTCTSCTLGLKSDGSVVATEIVGPDSGKINQGQNKVEDWKNIVAISASGLFSVGLTSEGKIVTAGNTDAARLAYGWKIFNSVDTYKNDRKQKFLEQKKEGRELAKIKKEILTGIGRWIAWKKSKK